MEKLVEISLLCEYYGILLSERQYQCINDYYNNDLSLSEIAQNYHITRQAVRDNIKKGEKKLFEYEEKLGFMKRTRTVDEKIADILSELMKIEENSSYKKVAKILEHVKSELNCLV